MLYEAPHRLARTLADLAAACGADRRVAIARELTKLHEETWRGTLAEAPSSGSRPRSRGASWSIVLDGAPPAAPADEADVTAAVQARLDAGDSARDAAATVAAALGVPRRQAYDTAVTLSRR